MGPSIPWGLNVLKVLKKKSCGENHLARFLQDDKWVSFKLNWTQAAPFGGGVVMKEYLGRTHQEFIRCSELELEERLGRPSALGDYLAYMLASS